jgi:tRNA(fMet)-specific endonuclease VapC
MKRILLDTNAYARLLAGDDHVLDALSGAAVVYMSVFVLGELVAGFAGGSKEQQNRETLGSFLRKPTVKILNATSETADIFGFVKSRLKLVGTPIPINDVWIAAHGLETGSTVITFDRHFHKVAGLRLWERVQR